MRVQWTLVDLSTQITTFDAEYLARERHEGEPDEEAVVRLAIERVQPKCPALAGATPLAIPDA